MVSVATGDRTRRAENENHLSLEADYEDEDTSDDIRSMKKSAVWAIVEDKGDELKTFEAYIKSRWADYTKEGETIKSDWAAVKAKFDGLRSASYADKKEVDAIASRIAAQKKEIKELKSAVYKKR